MTENSVSESANIPDHVPPKRIVPFNHFHIEPVDGDLHLGWKRVHLLPDVFYTPCNGGHWVFTRAADIEGAYRDPQTYSSRELQIPRLDRTIVRELWIGPAEFDAPEHALYRKLITPFFSAARLATLRVAARALAERLIGEIAPQGQCEFVSAFARRYPIEIFLNLMDLPIADAARLLPHADLVIRGDHHSDRVKGISAIFAYLKERIEERKSQPGADLMSQIVRGDFGGRPVTSSEALSACANVMFAGLDTVVAAASFMCRFLATSPAHRRELIDQPALIPSAVEELLRYHGLVNLGRVLTRDVEVNGVLVRKGDQVLLPTTLHGLDERRFPDPLRINFARTDRRIFAFGAGPHVCIGAPLARIELPIFLEVWLKHIPDFHITPGAEVRVVPGGINSVARLPLSWH